jgi:hypothetical protein
MKAIESSLTAIYSLAQDDRLMFRAGFSADWIFKVSEQAQ